MRAWRTGQVLRHALLHGDIEHLAPGGYHHALALRGEAGRRDILSAVLYLRAGIDIIGRERDAHLLRFFHGSVHLINIATVLEHDLITKATGELHVVFGEVGHLACLARLRVVDEYVHRVIPVGEEEDLIADPHGEDVLRLVVRHVRHALLLRVVDPDVVRHTAFVIFPRTELAHHPVVRQSLAVRGVATEAALGQGNGLGKPALFVYRVQLPGEAIAYPIAIHDARTVGRPGHHDVVRPHTVAQVIATIRRRISDTQGLATRGGHRVHLRIAIVLAGEGDRLPIRRETREHLVAHVRRKPAGLATRGRHLVQIPGVREDDLLSVRGGETQQPCLFRHHESGSRGQQRKNNAFPHNFYSLYLNERFLLRNDSIPP